LGKSRQGVKKMADLLSDFLQKEGGILINEDKWLVWQDFEGWLVRQKSYGKRITTAILYSGDSLMNALEALKDKEDKE
jgi:hypothetical protein